MKDTEFYESILGLRTPWRVEAVQLDTGNKSVEVKVKDEEGTLWASEAGERLPVYDHVERCWRPLDPCGFETRLRCRVPAARPPASLLWAVSSWAGEIVVWCGGRWWLGGGVPATAAKRSAEQVPPEPPRR